MNLREGRLARGRGIIAKRRKPAVVRGPELSERNVLRRLQNPITHFFRRIDRLDDADEYPLVRLYVFPDRAAPKEWPVMRERSAAGVRLPVEAAPWLGDGSRKLPWRIMSRARAFADKGELCIFAR